MSARGAEPTGSAQVVVTAATPRTALPPPPATVVAVTLPEHRGHSWQVDQRQVRGAALRSRSKLVRSNGRAQFHTGDDLEFSLDLFTRTLEITKVGTGALPVGPHASILSATAAIQTSPSTSKLASPVSPRVPDAALLRQSGRTFERTVLLRGEPLARSSSPLVPA